MPYTRTQALADQQFYSDYHKDVHGFRPRILPFESLEAYDEAIKSLDWEADEERRYQKVMAQERAKQRQLVKAKIADVFRKEEWTIGDLL